LQASLLRAWLQEPSENQVSLLAIAGQEEEEGTG
jgi:hypothetical protein